MLDETVTEELFQWSYRHLTENANNLIKGPEKGREKEGEKGKEKATHQESGEECK